MSKKIEFNKADLQKTCNGMTCDFFVKKWKNGNLVDMLHIKYKGTYRSGSSGKSEMGYIIGNYELGAAVWDPFKIIVDISQVEYEWGDDMELLFHIASRENTIVIVGDKNRHALSTLFYGPYTDKDIVDNDDFFDNLEKGIDHLNQSNY